MNITKTKFNESFDKITINSDFNDIKNRLNFSPNIENKKRNIKPLIYSLLPLLIIALIVPLLINGFSKQNEPKYADLMKYSVEVNKTTSNTEINDEDINITLPMMYNECNLDENINVNSRYLVFKDGVEQDKEHLNLSLGDNLYEVVVYKLNNASTKYNLNIMVGK